MIMKLGNVKIRLVDNDELLKAVASVVIDDCFAIHDIKIINGKAGLFISMPSRKTPEGHYRDIAHPLDSETRELFSKTILSAYEDELKAADES